MTYRIHEKVKPYLHLPRALWPAALRIRWEQQEARQDAQQAREELRKRWATNTLD